MEKKHLLTTIVLEFDTHVQVEHTSALRTFIYLVCLNTNVWIKKDHIWLLESKDMF